MKKIILALVFLSIVTMLFSEIPVVVQEVHGKVALKAPGRAWIPAKVGMQILKKYTISTGFNSKAVLKLGESVLVVKQLTRMELADLVEKKGVVRTNLYLRVGKIKARVKKSKGLRQDFRIKSPVATAAVRGTSFEFDGKKLVVSSGTVSFINSLGQKRSIGAGELSVLRGVGLPVSAQEAREIAASFLPESGELADMLRNIDTATLINILGELEDYANSIDITNVNINITWD